MQLAGVLFCRHSEDLQSELLMHPAVQEKAYMLFTLLPIRFVFRIQGQVLSKVRLYLHLRENDL